MIRQFVPIKKYKGDNSYKYCNECRKPGHISELSLCRSQHHFLSDAYMMICLHCNSKLPTYLRSSHKCYCKKKDILPIVDENKIFFYDMEAMVPSQDQIEIYKEELGFDCFKKTHTINLVVIQNFDGSMNLSFNTVDEFCDFIFSDKRFENSKLIAHNGGGYDVHFICKWLFDNGHTPEIIPSSGNNPSRYVNVVYMKRSFIDSINFIDCALSKFGKAFGLEVKKGYFPHAFNTSENQDYRGSFPDISYFELDNMKFNSKQDYQIFDDDFSNWYEESKQSFYPFTETYYDLQEQLLKYCEMDVTVLRQGCMKFRHMFLTLNEGLEDNDEWNLKSCDPFAFLTMSSLVITIAVSGFTDIQIAHFPPNTSNQLVYEFNALREFYIQNLGWTFESHEINNTHYMEIILSNSDNRICKWYHFNCDDIGCKACYQDQTQYNPFRNKTRGDCWDEHMILISSLSPTDHISYSHTLDDIFSTSTIPFLLKHKPIEYRAALYGGRVELFMPYAKGRICHIDVCSLYPSVCAFDILPMGHPIELTDQVIINEMIDNRTLFGFLCCSVTCPDDLLIPTIPYKRDKDNRLVFDLEDKTGVWTSVDLYFALDQGYKITEVYRANHFPESSRKQGLFLQYVNTFLAIKAKAKREFNTTQYLIAKKLLNTLWGKFCEKPHTDMIAIISNCKEYWDIMNSSYIEKETMTWIELHFNLWMVRGNLEDRFIKHTTRYNPALGCFVLSHARRRLHEKMVQIGLENIIYCDTDSIVFTYQDYHSDSLFGEGLGEWENEVDNWPSNYIKEFIGVGPKSYCETYNESINGSDYLLRYKGVRTTRDTFNILTPPLLKNLVLSSCAVFPINFEELKVDNDIVYNRESNSLVVPNFSIVTKYDHGGPITTTLQNYKICSFNLTKRGLLTNTFLGNTDEIISITTYPFGHREFLSDQNTKLSLTYKIIQN